MIIGPIVLCAFSAFAVPEFSVTPYVQHPSTNAMSIIFFTTEPCAATVTCWRADGKGETNELTTSCVDVSDKLGKNALASGDTLTYQKQYRHRVRFEGLRTLTDYRYEVALGDGPLGITGPTDAPTYSNTFRTLPGKDSPVRFIGYCDCETTPSGSETDWSNHAGDYGVRNVSKYFVGLTQGYASNIVHMVSRKPDLITISGDLAAKGGFQKNWDEFWRQNAGANGRGYNDPAGSIPILAAIGNHDLKDLSSAMSETAGGESALEKYLTYFEYNSNGVHYAFSDGTDTPETRDMSQLFHREDLGPVTLIFLDTNKGDNDDVTLSTQNDSSRPFMRAPNFLPGSLQYTWLTNNLADAQKNAKFTFVINHHCPYSVGQHNRPSDGKKHAQTSYNTGKGTDCESAQPVRQLTETMIRYGVDAWLCGHDEIQEHSQRSGKEILPDGKTRDHTLNVYDLGSGGDGLRGDRLVDNPYEVFRAFENSGEKWENGVLVDGGCHYGFMEVDVTTNRLGKWTCSLTPCYDFIYKNSFGKAAGFELRRYKDRIIIDEESNKIVYQEWSGDRTLPADYVEYVRPPQASDEPPLPPSGGPTDLSPAPPDANPVALLSEEQGNYLYVKTVDERRTAAAAAEKIGRESAGAKLFCFGSPVTLSWKGTTGACTVSVKRLSDGKVVATETTGETSLTVCNLEIGAQYAWTVTCGEESASATFCTDDTPPRLIRSGQMRMMRDLGGWTGTLDGKDYRIRQDLIFRGAAADCPNPDEYLADDTARAFFRDVVGLRNEVDFRNTNDASDVSPGAKSKGMYMLDPKGEYGIAYNNFSFTAGSSLPTSGKFPEAVKFLTDPDNLPAYFHCKSGRDRTGMMAGFLLAVLGVSKDDILRDYQTTSDKDYYESHGFKTFLGSTLPNYKSSQLSLAENAKAYLIDRGLTDVQVEDFRKKMLIGYGEPPEPTYHVEEPVYVTATRVTFAAGQSTGTQYRGFLTKKGYEYAWGKDGEAKTDWKKSDGTPMELKKPEGEGTWELMVR